MTPNTNQTNPPPADPATERQLLGSLLLDESLLDQPPIQRIHVDYFSDEANRLVFSAMRALRAKCKPVAAALRDELRERRGLTRSSEAACIAKIVNSVTHHHAWPYYAERLEQSALKRELYAMGTEIATAACNGQSAGAIVGTLSQQLKELQDRTLSRDDIELLTAAQLAAGEFAVSYHVDGMLVKGQPAIVAGPQKSLKTSICLDLALSLASGTSFLGTWKCDTTKVLILSGESGLATMQETALRICRNRGLELTDVKGFTLGTWIPRFNDAHDLVTLRRALDRSQAEVLFIDPVYLAMPGDDAGNVFKMGESLRRISELAQESGVTPILVHHTRKGVEIGAMPELSWIAWSGFGEFARQWMLLNRRDAYEPGSGEHRLWLSAGGSAGHGGAWGVGVFEGTTADRGRNWVVDVRDASAVVKAAQVTKQMARSERRDAERLAREEQIRQKVLNLLSPGPMTRNAIKTGSRTSGKAVNEAIDALLESGDVEPCRVETKGGMFAGVRLRSDKVGQGRIVRPSPG